jgi:hypothetical protein
MSFRNFESEKISKFWKVLSGMLYTSGGGAVYTHVVQPRLIATFDAMQEK